MHYHTYFHRSVCLAKPHLSMIFDPLTIDTQAALCCQTSQPTHPRAFSSLCWFLFPAFFLFSTPLPHLPLPSHIHFHTTSTSLTPFTPKGVAIISHLNTFLLSVLSHTCTFFVVCSLLRHSAGILSICKFTPSHPWQRTQSTQPMAGWDNLQSIYQLILHDRQKQWTNISPLLVLALCLTLIHQRLLNER